jgi:outer membrane protein OmpA-like peptidoglycan-associated protein
LALTPSSAHADLSLGNIAKNIELRGIFGVRVFNNDSALGNNDPGETSISSAPVFGIRAEAKLSPRLTIEGEVPVSITKSSDDNATLMVADPRIQARYELPGDEFVRPHAIGGLGVPFVTSTNKSALEPDVQGEAYVGLGIRLERRRGLSFRADVRWNVLGARGDQLLTSEFEFLVSLYKTTPAPQTYSYIGASNYEPAHDPEAATRDRDGDRIVDAKDACPKRPEDRDGFQDGDGCPDIDNDLDRVLDVADKCPTETENLNGFRDQDGCPDQLPAKVAALEGVLDAKFNSAGTRLSGSSKRRLNQVAEVLKKHRSVLIEISGHSDNRGDEEKNVELSQRRADAVRDYLTRRGVYENRLRAIGYGSAIPVADNLTGRGRRKNRRVELRIVKPEY